MIKEIHKIVNKYLNKPELLHYSTVNIRVFMLVDRDQWKGFNDWTSIELANDINSIPMSIFLNDDSDNKTTQK